MARDTGYPVKIINPEVLQYSLSAYSYIKDSDQVFPMAVVQTKDGIATICSEGVGWKMSEIGELTIQIYNSDGFISYVDAPAVFVIGALTSGTEVELADFIRTFGARLDNNFHIWKNQIEGIPQVFEMESAK